MVFIELFLVLKKIFLFFFSALSLRLCVIFCFVGFEFSFLAKKWQKITCQLLTNFNNKNFKNPLQTLDSEGGL